MTFSYKNYPRRKNYKKLLKKRENGHVVLMFQLIFQPYREIKDRTRNSLLYLQETAGQE